MYSIRLRSSYPDSAIRLPRSAFQLLDVTRCFMRMSQATLWCLVLAVLGGCREAPQLPPRAFRVQGRLFIDNNLASKACIAFHPVDKAKSQGRMPVAITKPDGSFELMTYHMEDGAPEGDYTVTLTWPDASMPEDECEWSDPLQHDRLGGKYADPLTTSLVATVLPRDNFINLSAQGARADTQLPNLVPPRKKTQGGLKSGHASVSVEP